MNEAQLARLPAVLFEIGKLVGSGLDPTLLFARIAELICELVDAQACSVMVLDGARKRLLAKAAHGLRADRLGSLSFAVGEGVAGWVVEHAQSVVIDDVARDSRYVTLPDSRTAISSLMCVPLMARDQAIGVVTATSAAVAAFKPHHLELLRFIATTIALDLENVRLHRVAVTDALTGAYNREFLAERLPAEVDNAVACGQPLSVAMIDVDHFKRVNDQYGHAVGDEVLAEIALRLRGAIRGGDLLVRYGGEEFLAVLPKAPAALAWEVGERMRQRTRIKPICVHDHVLDMTVSIGVAELHAPDLLAPRAVSDGDSSGPIRALGIELIGRADAALYTAKKNGRDTVEVSS